MLGRRYLFAGSTVALLTFVGFAVALDGACAPAANVIDSGLDAPSCDPDSSDPQAGCGCDPNKYKPIDCYTGPVGTQSKGICQAGKRSCTADGKLTTCVGEITPQKETCNLADDDCDGIVDDVNELDAAPIALCTSPACDPDHTEAGIFCWGKDPGICGAGVKVCAPGPKGGTPNGCEEYIKVGAPEICNGIDDDCNGTVDDGLDNEGACDLDAGSLWGDASPFLPEAGWDAGGGPAQVVGQCLHGQLSCIGGTDLCTPSQPTTGDPCNGKDDNCNGTVDEQSCPANINGTYTWCCSYPAQKPTYGFCEPYSFAQSYLDGGGFYWCRNGQ